MRFPILIPDKGELKLKGFIEDKKNDGEIEKQTCTKNRLLDYNIHHNKSKKNGGTKGNTEKKKCK